MNTSTENLPTLPTTIHWQDIFDDVLINNLRGVKVRVEVGHFPLNQTNSDGETVAHVAAKSDNLVMCQYFVLRDRNLLEVKDKWDQTVLAVAISKGSMYIVRYLVDDLKVSLYHPHQQRFGDMAIHIAAKEGQMEVLKYLVEEKGVDVNILNFLKEPPLFLAAEKPRMKAIKYLVEKADANVTILDSNNGNILYVSAKKGDLKVPKYLLDERNITFDINWQDIFGRTIVYIASRFNQIQFLKYCVDEKGADIHVPNNRGWTPLFEASSNDNIDVVKYLIHKGADLNHKDKENKTLEQVAETAVTEFLNKTRHERGRRSILEPTENIAPLSRDKSPRHMIWTKSTDLSFLNSNVGVSKFQSFLLILNVLFRYPRDSRNWNQQDALRTPVDMIRARMDHVAVEAIRQLPNL